MRIAETAGRSDVSSGRTQIWQHTIAEIEKAPLLGHGAGTFNKTMFETYGFDLNHPHQAILQYVYDWGFFGGTAALGILAFFLLAASRAARKKLPADIAFAAVAAICTTGVVAMIDGALFYPLSICLTLALAAPLFAYREPPLHI